jgi:hypothetical protein
MTFNQNHSPPKRGETPTKLADAAKGQPGRPAEQASSARDSHRVSTNTMAGLHEKAALDPKQLFQTSIDAATLQVSEASGRVTRAIGFSSEVSERLLEQSNKDMDIVARCGTALTQAFQDASGSGLEMSQKQWHRSLEGMQRLAGAKSVQEFATTPTELVRDSLEHAIEDSQAIAATSLKGIEQARDTFLRPLRRS